MIFDWAVSAIATSALIGAAAVTAERGMRLRQKATRFIWFGAIAAALLLPLLASLPAAGPITELSGDPSSTSPTISMPAVELPPISWASASQSESHNTAALAFKATWLAASAVMLAFLCYNALQFRRRKQRWQRDSSRNGAFYVSSDVGPAVFGFRQPSIVVPTWFRDLPYSQQSLILAHERSHIAARDPLLLLGGFLALAAVPWNLPLWWLFARLRRAIELDCDQRVLNEGASLRAYGETLIVVAERRSHGLGVALSMAGIPSLLKRRILIMSAQKSRTSRLVAAGLLGVAALVTVAAAQIRTASESTAHSQPQFVKVDSALLESYEGAYQYSATTVMHVDAAGDHLRVRFTGQAGADDVYPQSTATFFYVRPEVDASIEFQRQSDSTELAVLSQNGAQTRMPRLDEFAATSMESAVGERVASQVADAHSEAALRQLITDIYEGRVDERHVNAQLAGALRKDLPKLQVHLAQLGHPTAYTLERVSAGGRDEYVVTHEHGTSQWSVVVDQEGMITGATIPL